MPDAEQAAEAQPEPRTPAFIAITRIFQVMISWMSLTQTVVESTRKHQRVMASIPDPANTTAVPFRLFEADWNAISTLKTSGVTEG
jgi:hypothetical protein